MIGPPSLKALRRGRLVLCAILAAVPAYAQPSEWHTLEVPGGEATLKLLGVPDDRARALVMIDLIRRLHFSTNAQPGLEASLRQLSLRPPDASAAAVALPSPLTPRLWSEVLARDVPPQRLFIDILRDEHARLLYHGLAGLDGETRHWFQTQPALLRWLYQQQDAVRAFSMFAPGLRIVQGNVHIPGGPEAVRQWSSVLGEEVSHPETLVRRLFTHQSGRTAGLYFVYAGVDDPRRAFLMGRSLPPARRAPRFERLVSGFAACYPPRSTAYPFALRSHDAALLLLEVGLTSDGALAGPSDRKFWQEVFGDVLRGGADSAESEIDAAWLADALCGALAEHRAVVFATLLAGNRVFAASATDQSGLVDALRARRDYPALFMALEQAGLRRSRTYAAAARHAALVSRIDDVERSITAVRQFQGAVALTLNARIADTLTVTAAETLIESLAAAPLVDGRYEGRIVEWLLQQWLPAVRQGLRARDGLSAEQTVAAALAGPTHASLPTVHWEGKAYAVDPAGTMRQRLLEIRARQRGVSLDTVLALYQAARAPSSLDGFAPQLRLFTAADEYEGNALDLTEALTRADTLRVVDFLTAHVLPSWAYAPYLGTPDSGALVGGDGSLRHRLGVRLMGRDRLQQRWQIPVSPAARGIVQGSIFGVQTGLASWSLRRLASDTVPAAPALDSNDTIPLTLTAALINPRRLQDADLAHLAAAQAAGAEAIAQARQDPARLEALAATAAISPWSRAVLPWMVHEEPARVEEQFSPTERARVGGMRDGELAEWGSVWMPSGSLSPRMPPARIHELYAGRTADGIVGGRSIDLLLRVAAYLSELKLPAPLAAPVLSFAMRDHLDRVRPFHTADAGVFARQARTLTRSQVEDYIGALAAIGPLRSVRAQP